MKRLLFALLVSLAASAPARATLIKYEVSGAIDLILFNTLDPVPPSVSAAVGALRGQSIVGTFLYDNEAALAPGGNPNFGVYNGAIRDLQATVAGAAVTSSPDTAGIALVRNVVPPLPPGDQLGLDIRQPPGSLGQLLGYDILTFGVAWFSGGIGNTIPDFLSDGSLPSALPIQFLPNISAGLFVPGLTPTGFGAITNLTLTARSATIRQVPIPEPSSLALLALGLMVCAARASRKTR